jgi:hypothetical protein
MFDFLVRELADTHPSPPLDDLRDFVIDAEYAFKQPAGFDVVTVTTTDNPCSRLNVSVSLNLAMPSLSVLHRTLLLVWSELAFSYFAATTCDHYAEATVFRFVTVIAQRDFFITGTVIISGGIYGRLARQDQLTHGPLPRVPRPLIQRFFPRDLKNRTLA